MPESLPARAGHASAGTVDICIIGAGSSGMAVGKALKDVGLAFDCLEKGSDLGGMWRYENDGMSSAYHSLHIDTGRRNLGHSDFAFPDDAPGTLEVGFRSDAKRRARDAASGTAGS